MYGTPTMYIDLINVTKKLEEADRSIRSKMESLEIAVTAGALCTPELFRKMKYYFNFKHIYVSIRFIENLNMFCFLSNKYFT